MKPIVVPSGLHRLSQQHAPADMLPLWPTATRKGQAQGGLAAQQTSVGDAALQIGQVQGNVTITHQVTHHINHIGSQVTPMAPGDQPASRVPEPEPSAWPELIRASVWGGL